MVELSDYELLREQNIQRNKELLQALGIEPIAPAPKPPRSPTKKRKAVEQYADSDSKPPKKSSKNTSTETPGAAINTESLRRSSRNAGKVVDYKAERQELPSENLKSHLSRASEPRAATHRKHDPCVFELSRFSRHIHPSLESNLDIYLALKSVLGGNRGMLGYQLALAHIVDHSLGSSAVLMLFTRAYIV